MILSTWKAPCTDTAPLSLFSLLSFVRQGSLFAYSIWCYYKVFANEDLWRRLSTSTAAMLKADSADAGQTCPAEVTGVKGLICYSCWGSLDFPPAGFLPEVDPVGVIKGGDDLVNDTARGLTVSSKCRPLVVVDVAGTEDLFEGVFKTFLWCPSIMVASEEFTVGAILACDGSPFMRHALWLQQHCL